MTWVSFCSSVAAQVSSTAPPLNLPIYGSRYAKITKTTKELSTMESPGGYAGGSELNISQHVEPASNTV